MFGGGSNPIVFAGPALVPMASAAAAQGEAAASAALPTPLASETGVENHPGLPPGPNGTALSIHQRSELVLARVRGVLGVNETVAKERYRADFVYLSEDLGGGFLKIPEGASHNPLTPVKPHINGRPPRILIFAGYPLGSNGSGTWTRAMAQFLNTNGSEARVLHLGHTFDDVGVPEYLIPFASPHRAAFTGAAKADMPIFVSNPASEGTRFKNLSTQEILAYTEGLADAMAVASAHFKPDCIIVNHVWLAAEAASRTGLPFICVAHGTCTDEMRKVLAPESDYPQELATIGIRAARKASRIIVAVNNGVMNDVHSLFDIPLDKIAHIENGFEASVFKPDPSLERAEVLRSFGIEPDGITHVVAYAGRMAPTKGIATLLEAAKRVAEKSPGIRFLLAGNGKEMETYRRAAAEMGVEKNVHFLGHRSREDLVRVFNISDLGVVPSLTEPFGIVALEIAGTGTPVIASAVGGLAQFVTPAIGRQVPPGEASALALAIEEMLAQNAKAQMAERVAKYVHERFPWWVAGKRVKRLVEEILSGEP